MIGYSFKVSKNNNKQSKGILKHKRLHTYKQFITFLLDYHVLLVIAVFCLFL